MQEHIVTMEAACAAAAALGLDSGNWFDVGEVVGRMTGLDMTQYDCVQIPNAHAWAIRRKPENNSPCSA